MKLRDHIFIGIVVILASLLSNMCLEWWKGKQNKELSQQERIWNLKIPIYLALAEEFEGFFIAEDKGGVNIEAKVKSFNTLYNKLFVVGDDNLVKQLNQTDKDDTREYIRRAIILMRKELNPDTTLTSDDYSRKSLKGKEGGG